MRAGRKGEFSPGERMFVCQLKLAGNSFPNILRKFQERFGKTAPCRSAMNAMAAKMKTKFTVWNLRKGNSGLKKTVRTPQVIASVQRSLERAAQRKPGQHGQSARRNPQNLSKSSYNRITKLDLKLKPNRILRLHK